jgi:hypothetical protein
MTPWYETDHGRKVLAVGRPCMFLMLAPVALAVAAWGPVADLIELVRDVGRMDVQAHTERRNLD